jgi:hypothetical protein
MWKGRAAGDDSSRPVHTKNTKNDPPRNDNRPSAAMRLANIKAGKGGGASLTRAQVEKFLSEENRSAVSLLLASLLCEGCEGFREEAAERYPNDPMVAAWMMPVPGDASAPRAEWVETLRKYDPENALGWHQAARAALQEGREDEALSLLAEAAGKKDFHFYADKFSEAATRAWLSAGYTHLEAEAIALTIGQMMQGHLYAMEVVAKQIRNLPQEKADIAAKALLQVTARINNPGATASVQEAVFAYTINKNLAWTIDLQAPNSNPGFTAAERQSALRKESSRAIQLESKFTKLLPQLSDTDLKQYLRRVKVEGEIKAMEWVVQTKGAAR